MLKIKTALISVSDKTGIVDFARELKYLGVEIISTGGTAKLLRENNIDVSEVSNYTGFPEMLDGRIKTLHPKIHAGLLALRDNPQHMQTLKEYGIKPIDMVVVNLYPFQEVIKRKTLELKEAIENIDIGGPTMLRAAAKNYKSVAVICDPLDYKKVITELTDKGYLSEELLKELALKVFSHTANYDASIYNYLNSQFKKELFPKDLILSFEKIQDLRYGENPHQKSSLYRDKDKNFGIVNLKQLQGKELSFNNILDLDSAFNLVKEFQNPSAVIVKHNNPCGVAEAKTLKQAFLYAYRADPLSSFGGIVALNRKINLETAKVILKSGFLECIIAPAFEKRALSLFKEKKNLRILELDELEVREEFDFKRISGGLLLQEKDLRLVDSLKVVTEVKPTANQIKTLIFAFKVSKHLKSNAIVLAKGTKTIGIGAGQMSRLDSVIIAIRKAGNLAKGSCLASDGFFPKKDAVLEAIKAGVKAIIQPGGSIADEEIIKLCDRYKIPMVFTGTRHFRH